MVFSFGSASSQTTFSAEEVFASYIVCLHNATIDISRKYHRRGTDADPYQVFEKSTSRCSKENVTASKLLAIEYGSTDYIGVMEVINAEIFSDYIFGMVIELNTSR